VAEACGIEDFRAGLTPEGKMRAVQAMQSEGARVMMVGDGINDAPVLARADVSAAMGGATALARSSADIVLLSSRLEAIVQIFAIAARTRRVVRQNLAWALAYNFGAIPAASLGLVAPWLAALGMSLSSLVVVLNALRLSR
jgi:Cu2+-exporting ATPase